jgi:tRNA A-37 threonylcarbamoyl transferase component Bud32/tetratricopeptide (TPR) repeat protein
MNFIERLQTALGSAYTIERELGGGGMSRVFVAEELALGRKVVIKVLPPELAAELSTERFEREIRLAAQLQHPQIVPVLTAGAADGLPYYTMPLVDGESLRAQLAHGPLPVARVIGVLRDVAKALEFAHARGVVHRDIKPDNVLLAGSSAAVTDFGIAKALSASKQAPNATLTQMGTSIGTPSYMAPEQAAGDPDTDHRADIYAFGCMAYELLTGATPFGDKPPHQQIVAHFSEVPAPIEQRRPDVPPSLARLVMRCLEKDAAARPQTATELLAELDGVGTGSRDSANRPATAVGTRGARRGWLIGGAAAVVVAAGAAFAFTRGPTKTVDQRAIAVLPFRVAGADPSLHYLREGMLDLLAAKVTEGAGGHSLDSRTMLAAWRKAGGDDRTDLTDDASRQMAVKVGAGQIIAGDIVGNAKQLTIHAALTDVASGKRTEASVVNSADSLPAMVDRLAAELLTRRAGEGEQRLSALMSTSLPALKTYLDGQANYRRGRWEAASGAFNAALDIDSTFALAALGVLEVRGWFAQTRDPRRAGLLAWKKRDQFSARDRAQLAVLIGPNYPKISTIADRGAAAERYAALAADAPDAWYQVGDWYFHYGAGSGVEDSERRALNAFSRALQLDSTFTPAMEHLPMLYAATGDSAKLRWAIGVLAATDSGDALVGERMLAAVALGDSAQARAFRAQIPRMSLTNLAMIANAGRTGRLGVDDAQRAIAASAATASSEPERNATAGMVMMLESDLGHRQAAMTAAKKIGWADPASLITGAMFWDWDTTGVAAAFRAYNSELRTHINGTLAERRIAEYRLGVEAQYYAWRGDAAGLARTADEMRRIAFPGDTSGFVAEQGRMVLIADAQLAAMTKRADARALLTRLDSVAKIDPRSQLGLFGNAVAARGWELLGDPAKALAAVRRGKGDGSGGYYLAPRLRDEARLAAMAGDREGAMRAYRQYLVLRSNPDPELKPLADEARAELKRLEAGRAR